MKVFFISLCSAALLLIGSIAAIGQSTARPARVSSHDHISKDLVTPSPSDGARRLYQFLYDNYGRRIISGVMTLNSFDETEWLRTNTGKEPALVGLDFMHSGRGYNWYNDRQPIIDAKAYYERNGIPAMCWHWRDPLRNTEEFYTNQTTFDVSKIFDETSAEYAAMIADIDFISGLLKELRDDNVPVIWRPLHEAAGGWFWWGAKGPEACKKLYQVMFDRMVNHHGLNNLIWVWTSEPNDTQWYPGDNCVDIVGRDLYKDGVHTSHIDEWSTLDSRFGSKKIITMSECGSFPDPDNLSEDNASWSWFMPWYGQFVRNGTYNSLSLWKKTMAHEFVITLDEMPDLKTYEEIPQDDHITGTDFFLSDNKLQIIHLSDEFIRITGVSNFSEINVYNLLGQQFITHREPSTSVDLNISSLQSGVYVLKVDNFRPVRIGVK